MPRLSRAAAQERESRIVELAEQLFIKNGYDNTTVDQIVREMRLAKGTYYYHFDSKEDLLVAVSDKLISETSQKLVEAYNEKSADIISSPPVGESNTRPITTPLRRISVRNSSRERNSSSPA